ncbi:hypothetical protein [Bacillus nitratireducens]|uniref:HEPN AbiU2-like domain-containing protein n=1 Tax=Bacillus nitratireducens TaxID=2026193 RepID=A0ABU6P664_9BACI|nr:hypothetical protein [Bacillus nitratireducens]
MNKRKSMKKGHDTMNLWENREKAIQALNQELYKENQIIHSLFELFDNVIESYTLDTPFLRVTGIISIKIRSLCHGMLSLALDGHAQESGALFRTVIEAYESLVYLRKDPSRVNRFLEDKKPQAGDIAKAIQGQFKEVRAYLNNHASHFGFKSDSVMYFLKVTHDGDVTLKEPSFNSGVFRGNLGTLSVFMINTLFESIACLHQNDIDVSRWSKKLELLYKQVQIVFVNEVPNEL